MSCTVAPRTSYLYQISEDKSLSFNVFSKNIFILRVMYFQLDNRQTPHSPVTIKLPKYSPDFGLYEKHYPENVCLDLSLFALSINTISNKLIKQLLGNVCMHTYTTKHYINIHAIENKTQIKEVH